MHTLPTDANSKPSSENCMSCTGVAGRHCQTHLHSNNLSSSDCPTMLAPVVPSSMKNSTDDSLAVLPVGGSGACHNSIEWPPVSSRDPSKKIMNKIYRKLDLD